MQFVAEHHGTWIEGAACYISHQLHAQVRKPMLTLLHTCTAVQGGRGPSQSRPVAGRRNCHLLDYVQC